MEKQIKWIDIIEAIIAEDKAVKELKEKLREEIKLEKSNLYDPKSWKVSINPEYVDKNIISLVVDEPGARLLPFLKMSLDKSHEEKYSLKSKNSSFYFENFGNEEKKIEIKNQSLISETLLDLKTNDYLTDPSKIKPEMYNGSQDWQKRKAIVIPDANNKANKLLIYPAQQIAIQKGSDIIYYSLSTYRLCHPNLTLEEAVGANIDSALNTNIKSNFDYLPEFIQVHVQKRGLDDLSSKKM